MSPDDVQDLVVKAFVLEAISDKEGCTTRYADMPGKPLEDFLLAGINTGQYFRRFAADIQDGKTAIFDRLVPALAASQQHRAGKVINLGLLEIMFPTVYARLGEEDANNVIDRIVESMKARCASDVQALKDGRRYAWQTSMSSHKREMVLPEGDSPYEFYSGLLQGEPSKSSYQWAEQFEQRLPILREFFDDLRSTGKPALEQIPATYRAVRQRYPHVKVGIVADMCAAAIFLKLSYEASGDHPPSQKIATRK